MCTFFPSPGKRSGTPLKGKKVNLNKINRSTFGIVEILGELGKAVELDFFQLGQNEITECFLFYLKILAV